MRENFMSGLMRGRWKPDYGTAIEAPPRETGGQRLGCSYGAWRHLSTLQVKPA